MKTKTKPVVKYHQYIRVVGGKKHRFRVKYTLVGIITGKAAKVLNESSEKGESLMHSYDPKNMKKRELWREETLH